MGQLSVPKPFSGTPGWRTEKRTVLFKTGRMVTLFGYTKRNNKIQLSPESVVPDLDDGAIGGNPESVERDILILITGLATLDLHVNMNKSEFFA
ncbi:hypothetical protein EVAR_71131_1 [Eumeta japonica]|uniref:Uncharacterized protein n=1 Tax=Eumeta variegata TaxID=151549 RepID=A0A4C1ZRL5_EUMVA|nr:hypothetical protein EVAR_71131_1 [Eumeta japonica]